MFGIKAGDPTTYAAFLIIAGGVIAIPAMRAARLEPVTALRNE